MSDDNNDLDEIEDELKQEVEEEEKTGHKVSGRSVFEVERIIKEKAEKVEAENRHEKDN